VPDAAAIDRILAAMAKPKGKGRMLVARADRDLLQVELSIAGSVWLTASRLHSNKIIKREAHQRSEFSKFMSTHREWMVSQIGLNMGDPRAFRETLEAIIGKVEHEQNMTAIPLSQSPEKWFVAEILWPIYVRVFGEEPGISKPHGGGSAYGPFVTFAVCVRHEMGSPISPNTVAQAVETKRRRMHRIA
jgi:hypothetical protein